MVSSPKNKSGKAKAKRPKALKYLSFAAVFFGSKKSRVSFGRAWTGPTRGWTGSTALGLFDGLGQRGWGAKEVIQTDELRLNMVKHLSPVSTTT